MTDQWTSGSGEGWASRGRPTVEGFERERRDRHRTGGDRRRRAGEPADCRCRVTAHGDRLVVDARGCPGSGRLARSPACRETVIEALSRRDATAVCTRVDDTERAYAKDVAAFLLAAGRFVALCVPHDEGLAARARRDPLGAARLAAGRSDSIANIAAETGFLEGATRFGGYREAFGDPGT